MSSKAYPFMVLGSSLKPLMDLGLPSFSLLQAQVFYFYGVQFSVPFSALVQHCDFLDLNNMFIDLTWQINKDAYVIFYH